MRIARYPPCPARPRAPAAPAGANLFFQLVNARYEKGATVLTSNRGFKDWGTIFGDNVVAAALLDRLREHANLVPDTLKGRTPQAPEKPKRKPGRPRQRQHAVTD